MLIQIGKKAITHAPKTVSSVLMELLRYVRMTIKIPKGAKAINVEDISRNSQEQETILPPGSQFKITEIKQNHKGFAYHIDCEVML